MPCPAVYVATGGSSQLFGIVRRLVGEAWLHAHPFHYSGAVGPWRISANVRDEIACIGDTLASHFALRGLFGVDFILDGDRVWTMEVNPRYFASAEIVEQTTGLSLLGAYVAACRDEVLVPAPHFETEALFGKAILFTRQAVEIVADLRQPSQQIADGIRTSPQADVPRIGIRIAAARPVLTRFATGATTEEVVTNLKSSRCICGKTFVSSLASSEVGFNSTASVPLKWRDQAMRVGIISDTHGQVDFTRPAVRMFESLGVERVFHCGDIGSPEVVELFTRWPTDFVFGNCDTEQRVLRSVIERAGQSCHGEFADLEIEGIRIALLHSHDRRLFSASIGSGRYGTICYGHTHVAAVELRGETLLVNPGAIFRASPHSVAVLDLPENKATIVEL